MLKKNSCFTHVTLIKMVFWWRPHKKCHQCYKQNVGKNSDKFLLLQLLFITTSNHIRLFFSFFAIFFPSLSSRVYAYVVCVLSASYSLASDYFFPFFFPLKHQKWSQSNESHHKTARSQKLTRKLEANVLILHFVSFRSQLLANPHQLAKSNWVFVPNFCLLSLVRSLSASI